MLIYYVLFGKKRPDQDNRFNGQTVKRNPHQGITLGLAAVRQQHPAVLFLRVLQSGELPKLITF
jgi:hypothetical protein